MIVSFVQLAAPLPAQNASYIYFRNFVRHSNGEFCTHVPPQASFTVYLNNDPSRVLFENAPRWDTGAEPNIDGKGTFGVELGNFAPPLVTGDSVFVRFNCHGTQEQGVLKDFVYAIPFYRFPLTLDLKPVKLPEIPADFALEIDANRNRKLSWTADVGIFYSIYRRTLSDTLANGRARMSYTRIASDLTNDSFVDTTRAATAHGYVIIPRVGTVYGAHSSEIGDFPPAVTDLAAAVTAIDPLQVALSWQYPETGQPARFHVYRSTTLPVAIRPENFIGSTEQLYWLDARVTLGTSYFYRIVGVNAIGISGPASETVSITVTIPKTLAPDLDLLYISRSPKYPRFIVDYDPPGYNPHLRPGTDEIKHYPEPGEMMRYRAVIRNSGSQPVTGFNLVWRVDSVLAQSEHHEQLLPYQKTHSVLRLPWTDKAVRIECRVQSDDSLAEQTIKNNTLTIRSDALSFHFHVEQNIIALFQAFINPLGSYNFEDWAQVHIAKLNLFFARAIYPNITPTGIQEAVFLDSISYYENGQLPAGGTHAPESELWDGLWGFTGDAGALNYFENIVIKENQGMDWALLHELGHQLGLIDLYQMDVHLPQVQVIEPRTGRPPALKPIAWEAVHYCSRSNFLMHSNYQAGFSDHSAAALQRNRGKRRGFFGEYLADIPRENHLQVKKPNGAAVRNAELWVYQKQDGVIPNLPKFKGWTDSTGLFTFPHQTDSLYGRLAAKNPFSTRFSADPHVVATNATLFMRVAKADSVGYGFIDICDFNVAYWSGQRGSAIYSLTISQWQVLPITEIASPQDDVPEIFHLAQNYPNPFNSSTSIRYHLPKPARVELVLFDVLGQIVRVLAAEYQKTGAYNVTWDGRDARGQLLSSGIYFYRLHAGDYNAVRKILLLR